MTTFEVVPEDVRKAKRASGSGRTPSPLTLALEQGQTIFIPVSTWPKKNPPKSIVNQPTSRLRRLGMKAAGHLVERDGVKGWVLWAEPLEETDA